MMNFHTLKKYLFILTIAALFFICAYTLFTPVKSHIDFINFPYQHEYMEGAVLSITGLYTLNENPYDIIRQPQNTYGYGFLYPIMVAPLAKIIGNNLIVHRWFNYVFILLTCLLIFLALNFVRLNPVFSFAAAVIVHQTLVYNGWIAIARPEALGIFLFTLGILIPWRFKYSSMSLIISIFIGILAFLTKAYYILLIPYICIYIFIFVSKKKALWYAGISIILFLIVMLIVHLNYETFLNNSFFNPENTAGYDFAHMTEQLTRYLRTNLFLLAITFISIIFIIKTFSFKKFSLNRNLNVLKDEPVIKSGYDLLFTFVFMLSMLLFIVKFGGHLGAGKGAYLYHLNTSFFILMTFQLLQKVNDNIVKSIAAILIIYTLTHQFKTQQMDYAASIVCYEELESLISRSKNPLNSPETVSIMIDMNKAVLNSGHSQYFRNGISGISRQLGFAGIIEKREEEFEKELNDQIRNKEFDLIMQTKGNYYRLIDTAVLIQNYQITDTVCAYMPLKEWKIDLWYPK